MNLQEAQSFNELRNPVPQKKRQLELSNLQIAERVFDLAASGGFPYLGMTHAQWAKKWLPSKRFVLMEIDINAAASPHLPRNPDRVAFRLLCSKEAMPPIVVDLNKQGVGRTLLGYVPSVVVLDGKHRKMALQLQGHSRIMAWVGIKAAGKLKNTKVLNDLALEDLPHTNHTRDPIDRISASFQLHAAVVPGAGMPVIRQDAGEGGSRPSAQPTTVRSSKKVKAGGPGSGRRAQADDEETYQVQYGDKKPAPWEDIKGKKVKAGGPGSGRHPGFGTSNRDVAKNHGYEFTTADKRGGFLFNHPDRKQDSLFLYRGGDWEHRSGSGTKSGNGADKLDKFLSNRFSVKSAGGAGAGGMGGPGASNAGGSGANPLRKGMFSSKDCNCNGIASGKPKESARSTGQIDDDDSSEKKVPPDSSDAGTFVKPSDRRKWLLKPNLKAPGTSGHSSTKRFSNAPDIVSPGSGVGPRVLNPGASRSDVAKALKAGKGVKVPKMFTKAPPGMEDMVLDLKKKYGEDSSTPFKIAWSKYKGEMDAAAKEFLASWTRRK